MTFIPPNYSGLYAGVLHPLSGKDSGRNTHSITPENIFTMLNCSRIQISSCVVVIAILISFSSYIFNLDGGRKDFNNSVDGDIFRHSLLLKGVDLIGIGSSMPLLLTVCLDMGWPTSTIKRWHEPASLIAVTITPLVCHLVTSNYHWGPHFTNRANV